MKILIKTKIITPRPRPRPRVHFVIWLVLLGKSQRHDLCLFNIVIGDIETECSGSILSSMSFLWSQKNCQGEAILSLRAFFEKMTQFISSTPSTCQPWVFGGFESTTGVARYPRDIEQVHLGMPRDFYATIYVVYTLILLNKYLRKLSAILL